MQLTQEGHYIELRLSRRNLLSLLEKLDRPDSARTITKVTRGRLVSVIAEDDADHYGTTEPGPMHPATEQYVAEHGGRTIEEDHR